MNLRRLNIAPRSLLCFGFFALLITALGLYSLLQASNLQDARDTLQNEVMPTVQSIAQIESDLLTIRLGNTNLRTAATPQALEIANSRITKGRSELETHVKNLKPLMSTEEGKQAYAQMERDLTAYLAVHSRYLDAVKQNREDIVTALTQATGEQTLAANKLGADITEISRLADLKAARSDEVADQSYSQSRNVTIAAIVLALVATLVLAALFTRSLVAPIATALAVAEQIASNDLSKPIDVDAQDEPGRLLGALSVMQQNLRRTLGELGDSSNQLASTSEEMTAVTEDSLRGVQRQNDEINQAATAINQMSAAVEEVARNAAAASSAAQVSWNSAESGRHRVG